MAPIHLQALEFESPEIGPLHTFQGGDRSRSPTLAKPHDLGGDATISKQRQLPLLSPPPQPIPSITQPGPVQPRSHPRYAVSRRIRNVFDREPLQPSNVKKGKGERKKQRDLSEDTVAAPKGPTDAHGLIQAMFWCFRVRFVSLALMYQPTAYH